MTGERIARSWGAAEPLRGLGFYPQVRMRPLGLAEEGHDLTSGFTGSPAGDRNCVAGKGVDCGEAERWWRLGGGWQWRWWVCFPPTQDFMGLSQARPTPLTYPLLWVLYEVPR